MAITVNRSVLNDLFRTYTTLFTEAMLAKRERDGEYGIILNELAMVVKVNGAATLHAWLEQTPGMKEWIGDRVLNNLAVNALLVENKPFEETIAVRRADIEDENHGLYTHRFAMLGANAEALWLDLAVDALIDNGVWADGNSFFCSDRLMDPVKGTKKTTNAVTTAFSKEAVEAAVEAMGVFTLYNGKAAQVAPRYLLVGPALESAARRILLADFIAVTTGSTTTTETNTFKNRLTLRVSRRIQGGRWFVLGEKNGMLPVCVQQRELARLTRMDSDTDESVFMRDEFRYGTSARGNGFLTLPFLAYAGGMDSVPAWDKKKFEATAKK